MAESIVNEASAMPPSRNDMLNAADLKLDAARAIFDAVATLDVHRGSTDGLKTHSLSTCLLHADQLLGEVRQMFVDAQARPAAVHHG